MKTLASICDGIVGVGIGALILFTPLAFGTVETWSIVVLETAVFALSFVWLLGRSMDRRSVAGTGLELPILMFVIVVGAQLLPLSRTVLSVISPRIAQVYDRTVPGFASGQADRFEEWLLASDAARSGQTPAGGGEGVHMPVSYSVPGTLEAIELFMAYALAFLIIADRYRDRARLRRLIVWIVFVGVGIAIEGIFQNLAWNGKILWLRRPPHTTRPFGPFVNANHFAGYMELIVPLVMGLLLTLLSRHAQSGYRLRKQRDESEEAGTEQILRAYPLEEEKDPALPWIATSTTAKALLLGFLFALSLASIVLSLSRGGILATLLTFAIFSPLFIHPFYRGRVRPGVVAGALALAVMVLGTVYWLGASKIAERMGTLVEAKSEPSFLGRADTWKRTLEMVRDHAILGTGLGAYENAFYAYAPPGSSRAWEQAHNDYLQLLSDVGVAGIIPALLALLIFARRGFLPALRDRLRPDRYLTLGLAMAIVSMLLHSLVDFNLQIPAVGFLFVVIGGLLVAAGAPSEAGTERRGHGSVRRLLAPLGAAVMLVFVCASAVLGRNLIAANDLVVDATQQTDSARGLQLFAAAMQRAPGQPDIVTSYGDNAIDVYDREYRRVKPLPEAGRKLLAGAELAYRHLAALVPCSSWGWWGLGEVYARRSGLARLEGPISLEGLRPEGEEVLGRDARLSLAALRTALSIEPASFQIYDDLANLYLEEGMRREALDAFMRSARTLPEYVKHQFPPVAELPEDVYRAIVEGMDRAIGETDGIDPALVQKQIGEMAQQRRNLDEAERRFRLGLAASVTKLDQEVLSLDLGELLRQKKRHAEAVPYLERAAKSRVVGWLGWICLGQVRVDTGDHKSAAQAYRAAASLAPTGEALPVLLVARETALAGDRRGAISQLRYLIGTQPAAVGPRELLVQVLREDGQRTEALAEARSLLALAPARTDYARLVAGLEQDVGTVPIIEGGR